MNKKPQFKLGDIILTGDIKVKILGIDPDVNATDDIGYLIKERKKYNGFKLLSPEYLNHWRENGFTINEKALMGGERYEWVKEKTLRKTPLPKTELKSVIAKMRKEIKNA